MNINDTLAERGARYGVFADHAQIAQGLQDTMRAAPGWTRLAFDQKQALSVISDKIARMLNGDPNYVDNWHDIIGYAKLVEDRLLSSTEQPSSAATPNPTDVLCAGSAISVQDALLHQPALDQNDDPEWYGWNAMLEDNGTWRVRRFDTKGFYQDEAKPDGSVWTSHSEREAKTHANKLNAESATKWSAWHPAPSALKTIHVVRRVKPSGEAELYERDGSIEQFADFAAASAAADSLNNAKP